VLINDEGQYSLWPAVNGIPAGWHAVGPTGPKSVCLAYVEDNWTDMRPRSLRS
jgi:MbtH protein